MANQFFIAVLLLVAFFAAPTHETTPSVEKEKATPRKLVGEFKVQTVVEKLIKLPQGVMVPNQVSCYPVNLCPPQCICVVDSSEPPFSSFCRCPPSTKTHETIPSVKALAATPKKMVGKFQDQTVEKLIKLPQRVGVPLGGECFPPDLECDLGCICMAPLIYPPIPGVCVGFCK